MRLLLVLLFAFPIVLHPLWLFIISAAGLVLTNPAIDWIAMKSSFLCILLFLLTMLSVQHLIGQDIWSRIKSDHMETLPANLSEEQIKLVRQLLKADNRSSPWGCQEPELDDALQDLFIQSLQVDAATQRGPGAKNGPGVLLIEPGAGCLRGGQGANAAMWVVDFRSSDPVLIASPADKFAGYLAVIGSVFSHGLPDIVLAWHMGAGSNPQTYFRFNGARYRAIAKRDQ